MKHSRLRFVIVFGSIVIGSLIAVQLFWFTRAFDITERQFNHTVNVSLNAVALEVALDSGVPIEVKNLSSNFFFVPLNTNIDFDQLDQLIKKEFLLRKLNIPYELGIYANHLDTLVYGNYIEATHVQSEENKEKFSNPKGSHKAANFAIYFPNKLGYLAEGLQIWIYSTITLLLMTGFFVFAILSLLREKRYADMKNDFISNMTHELKTPLTNIKIAHEVMSKTSISHQPYLDIIAKANTNLEKKIDHVLRSAIHDFQSQKEMRLIDLHELIKECADSFQLRVEQKCGKIVLDLQATEAFVLGDREYILQAFTNLMDNAEKYSDDKPEILLETKSTDNEIIFSVKDQGVGISKAFQTKVFDKFFRVNNQNSNVGGFGLGLSFVKDVITSHKGSVTLRSQQNVGTEVEISLPVTWS